MEYVAVRIVRFVDDHQPKSIDGGVMSKVMVAFVSFALGVLTSSLFVLSGSQASTVAQELTQPSGSEPVMTGGAGVPVVPPISQHFENLGLSGEPLLFGVDGAECDKCVFKGVTFRYGGGNFRFTDFKFSSPIRVEYVGAAANTMRFSYFLQALAARQLPKNPPKGPLAQVVTFNESRAGSFGTE
jgi:hypothetical protein